MSRPKHPQRRLNRRMVIAIAVLGLSIWVFLRLRQGDVNLFSPDDLKQVILRSGGFGPAIYISILMLSVIVFQIPGVPLAMAAGMVWGPVLAGVYSVIGGFLGAIIAYFLGHSLGRTAMKALTGKVIYFSKRRGEVYVGWIIFITRLLPFFSFDLVSYGAGIAGISLPIFCLATLLGMIPSTFLLTYLGSVYTVNASSGVVFTAIFLLVLLVLPWGIQRYNWFNLRDVVRFE